jgi:hypothetical protein
MTSDRVALSHALQVGHSASADAYLWRCSCGSSGGNWPTKNDAMVSAAEHVDEMAALEAAPTGDHHDL